MSPASLVKIKPSVGNVARWAASASTTTVGSGITRKQAGVLGGPKDGIRPEMPRSCRVCGIPDPKFEVTRAIVTDTANVTAETSFKLDCVRDGEPLGPRVRPHVGSAAGGVMAEAARVPDGCGAQFSVTYCFKKDRADAVSSR